MTTLIAVLLVGSLARKDPSLNIIGHLPYPSNELGQACDFGSESCAPLTDLWGYVSKSRLEYALVGVVNGLSVVEVTDKEKDKQKENLGASNKADDRLVDLNEVARFGGCLTEWRDIKTRGEYAYVVADRTHLCDCWEQPCQHLTVITNAQDFGLPATMASSLSEFGNSNSPINFPVEGELVLASPRNACTNLTNAESVSGKIALIMRGDCMFAEKVMHAENAGAIAAVIINDRYDIVPPSMTGNPDIPINIPSVMISLEDGKLLENLSGVRVSVSDMTWTNSSRFSFPDGLRIIHLEAYVRQNAESMTSPTFTQNLQFFHFAHNVFVETDSERPFMYVCGFSCSADRPCDIERANGEKYKGGIMVFDISSQSNPLLLSIWDEVYIHDIVVVEDKNKYILYASAIYDKMMYRFDVTNPAKLKTTSVVRWETPSYPHNSWPTHSNSLLYVTHEDDAMPITMWDLTDLGDVTYVGNISLNIENKTIPHNVVVQNEWLWASYYSEGVAVWDISSAERPWKIAQADTSSFSSGYHGVWGIYPLPGKTTAYASDIERGLFVMVLHGLSSVHPSDMRIIGSPGISAAIAFAILFVTSLALFGIYRMYKSRVVSGFEPSGTFEYSRARDTELSDRF